MRLRASVTIASAMPADVLDPVEPGAEVLDRPEPGRQVDRRLVAAGRSRSPRPSGRRTRPPARAPRPATRDASRGRARAGRASAPGTRRARSRPSRSRRGHRPPGARARSPPCRRPGGRAARRSRIDLDPVRAGVDRQAGHGLAEGRAETAVGGQAERVARVVDQPECRALDREQRDRVVDDVVEQAGQVGPAGDRRGDLAERPVAGDVDATARGVPCGGRVLPPCRGSRGRDRADT